MSDLLPFNEFLVVVGVTGNTDVRKGGGHRVLQSRVSADTGMHFPSPPPTVAEMQHVAHAAKMALIQVLKQRKSECSCGSNGGDAWKCAKRQGRMDMISCRCPCHRYIQRSK